jgi:hypothetical protein
MPPLFKKCILLLFILISFQSKSNVLAVNDTVIDYENIVSGRYRRISILPTGLHYEILGDKKNSFVLSAELRYYFGLAFYNLTFHFQSAMKPLLDIEYRHYYNLKKSIRKNKNVAFRSLNYFGVLLENRSYGYPRDKIDNDFFLNHQISYLGPVWGMQRTIGAKKRMYWGIEFGIGHSLLKSKKKHKFYQSESEWNVIGNGFTFGFVI